MNKITSIELLKEAQKLIGEIIGKSVPPFVLSFYLENKCSFDLGPFKFQFKYINEKEEIIKEAVNNKVLHPEDIEIMINSTGINELTKELYLQVSDDNETEVFHVLDKINLSERILKFFKTQYRDHLISISDENTRGYQFLILNDEEQSKIYDCVDLGIISLDDIMDLDRKLILELIELRDAIKDKHDELVASLSDFINFDKYEKDPFDLMKELRKKVLNDELLNTETDEDLEIDNSYVNESDVNDVNNKIDIDLDRGVIVKYNGKFEDDDLDFENDDSDFEDDDSDFEDDDEIGNIFDKITNNYDEDDELIVFSNDLDLYSEDDDEIDIDFASLMDDEDKYELPIDYTFLKMFRTKNIDINDAKSRHLFLNESKQCISLLKKEKVNLIKIIQCLGIDFELDEIGVFEKESRYNLPDGSFISLSTGLTSEYMSKLKVISAKTLENNIRFYSNSKIKVLYIYDATCDRNFVFEVSTGMELTAYLVAIKQHTQFLKQKFKVANAKKETK